MTIAISPQAAFAALVATVLLGAAPAAAVVPDQIETFEDYADGTASIFPFSMNDPAFGIISGGEVATPGFGIDAAFQINGAKVYYGSNILYTTYNPSHCCGYFYLGMLISSEVPVTVEYYGHGSSFDYADIALIYTTTVSGSKVLVEFGEPADPITEEGFFPANSDIVEVRLYTGDGTAFALDDFATAGEAAIPEPGTWAMLIAGFGLIGCALRRKAVPA